MFPGPDGWTYEGFCGPDGQCKIPDGGFCDFGAPGEQPRCESGYCLSGDILQKGSNECWSLGEHGAGCETDDDCPLLPGRTDNGRIQGVCDSDGECKIPNKGYCSFGPEGAQPMCASGYCLSGAVLNAQPQCGTLGPDGNGCVTDDDCAVFPDPDGYTQGVCDSDGQCKIPDGAFCDFGAPGEQPLCLSGYCNTNVDGEADLCAEPPTAAPTDAPTDAYVPAEGIEDNNMIAEYVSDFVYTCTDYVAAGACDQPAIQFICPVSCKTDFTKEDYEKDHKDLAADLADLGSCDDVTCDTESGGCAGEVSLFFCPVSCGA